MGGAMTPTVSADLNAELQMPSTRSIAVIGGGTMGVGIAYVAALAGGSVTIVETDPSRVAAVRQIIAQTARGGIDRGRLDDAGRRALIGRVSYVANIEELGENLDLVVESVPEHLDVKRDVLARAAARTPQLLATNTSALSIDALATAVRDSRRFLGMHFFNPVWSIKLVEIVRGHATSDASLAAARALVEWLGKQSVTVVDIPGFATSRLDLIASLEAMRMLESGVASAEDIDRAAVLAYRHPVGPLRLSDIVGLDVRLDIARVLEKAHGPRFSPPQILCSMVRQGRLGAKSGEGFYAWPSLQTQNGTGKNVV
jgi:3-hydroxybutyryl-CoA dehydrogenase